MPSSHPQPDDRLLSAYLDGELTDGERAQVEQRLAQDAEARQTVEQLRQLRTTLADLPPEKANADFTARVVQQIQAAVPASSQPVAVAGRIGEEPSGAGGQFTIGRSRRGWAWAAMAIAASVLLMAFLPQESREVAKQQDQAAFDEGEVAAPIPVSKAPLEIGAADPASPSAAEMMTDGVALPPSADLSKEASALPSVGADADELSVDQPTSDLLAPAAPPGPEADSGFAMQSRSASAEQMATQQANRRRDQSQLIQQYKMLQDRSARSRQSSTKDEASDLVVNVILTPAAYREAWVDNILTKQVCQPTQQVTVNGADKQKADRETAFTEAATARSTRQQQPSQVVDLQADQFAEFLSTLQINTLKCSSVEVEPVEKPVDLNQPQTNFWQNYNRLGNVKVAPTQNPTKPTRATQKLTNEIKPTDRVRALIVVEAEEKQGNTGHR